MAFYRTTMDDLMLLSFEELNKVQVLVVIWHIRSIFLCLWQFLFHHTKQSILNLIRLTHTFAAVVQVGMLQHRYSVGRGAIARMQDVFLLQIENHSWTSRELRWIWNNNRYQFGRRPLTSTYWVVCVFFSEVHHIIVIGCWFWHPTAWKWQQKLHVFFNVYFCMV